MERLASLRLPDHVNLSVLAQTLHCIQDAVTISDANDNLMYVNPAFTQLYGYAFDEVVGKPSSILWGRDSAESAKAKILPTTMQSEHWAGELTNRRKDGSEFPIQLTTAQVRQADGSLIALVGVARDITLQRAHQQQIESHALRMREELLAAQRVQEVLLPPLETIERVFPEVMLLPIKHDLLISELYWTAQHLDRSFLALANPGSTGVRAALASSLLYGLFNQVVNEKLITQPERVLDEIEHRVETLLDHAPDRLRELKPAVGFFSFAKNLRSARFAGIDVGLILFRKGKPVRLESDPSLAGELIAERPARANQFRVYNLSLQFGDTLYSYTPGLLAQADQARTPWTERELVAFLESHQQLTMAEQARSLESHLWRRRGGQPPLTDALMMGIRF